MHKCVERGIKRIGSTFLAIAMIVASISMPQAAIEAKAETVITANYYLVDGINEGVANNHAPQSGGVVWDSTENCAVFDGESWLEIDNPLEGVSAETGFYFSFEAFVETRNVKGYEYTRYNRDKKRWEKANCIGWQRILDLSDGTTNNYFFVNAGTSGPLNTAVKYSGGKEFVTTYGGSTSDYMGAWHAYTLVVSPDDGWKLYLDGSVIEDSNGINSTISQVLDDISRYNTCYVGTSVWEATGANPDGFFFGKMRNLTFASTSEVRRLSYEPNGGEVTDGYNIATSVAFALPEKFPTVKKDGYVFDGWYTDEACTEKAVEKTPIDFDTTLYAKWHEHDWIYTVTDNELHATCGSSDCPSEMYEPFYASVKLNSADTDYTAAAVDKSSILSFEGYDDFTDLTGATADVSQARIYATNDSGKTGEDISAAPLSVGDYIAEVDFTTKTGTETVPASFAVNKVNPSVTVPKAKTGLTYNGSGMELITAGSTADGEIAYKLSNEDEFSSAIPKATKPGKYTVIYKVTGDSNHNDIAETGIEVNIGKKNITVGISAEDKVYDGSTKTNVSYTVPSGDLCGSDNIVIAGLQGNFGNPNAGTDKTVTADAAKAVISGKNSDCYEITYLTTTANITKANHTVAPKGIVGVPTSILRRPDGKLSKLPEATVEYRLKGSSEFTEVTGTTVEGLASGTYEVRFKETANQNASPLAEVVITEGSKLTIKLPSDSEQIGYTITASPAAIAWDETSTLMLNVATGYVADTDFKVKQDDAVLVRNDLGANRYSFEVPVNSPSAIISVEGIRDKIAPTGYIAMGDTHFTSFTEGQTFGYYRSEKVDLSVSAQDTGSGIAASGGIAYYLSDTVRSEASIKSDDSIEWTNGSSFSIQPGNKKYVYVRLLDESGNVTYLSLDKGLVVFMNSEVNDANVTYSRSVTGSDKIININLNGNIVKEVKCTDGIGRVLTSGTDYETDGTTGEVTLKAAFLQTLSAGSTHRVEISYYPLGEDNGSESGPDKSTIEIVVTKSAGAVNITADISKTYDGDPVNKDYALINKTGSGYTSDSVTGADKVIIEYKPRHAVDSDYTEEAPVNVGQYTVRVSIAEDDNYTKAIGSRDFEIEKGAVGGTAVVSLSASEITYGSPISGAVSITGDIVGGVISFAAVKQEDIPEERDWSDELSTIVDAGIYDVYYRYTGDANHNDTAPIKLGSLTVAPKAVDVEWSETVTLTYNGMEQIPEVAVAPGELIDGDECEVLITGAGIHVSSYTATITGLSNENYCIKGDAIVTKDYTIEAKQLTLSVEDVDVQLGLALPDFVIMAEGIAETDVLEEIISCEVMISGDIEDDGPHDIVLKADAVLNSADYTIINGLSGNKLGTLTIIPPGPRTMLTFDGNGGKFGDETEVTVKFYEGEVYNSSANKLKDVVPVRSGFKFVGWYKNAEKAELIEDGDIITEAMTLYACWAYRATAGETAENTDMYVMTIPDCNFTGGAIKPAIKVTDGENVLKAGKDYKITYVNAVNANAGGKYIENNGLSFIDGKVIADNFDPKLPYVMIKGIGNYTSTIKMNYNIIPKDITEVDTDSELNFYMNQTARYNRKAAPGPGISIKFIPKSTGIIRTMKNGKDFTFTYEEKEGATPLSKTGKPVKGAKGPYVITIEGKGNYVGQIVRPFTITDEATSLVKANVVIGKVTMSDNETAITADKLNVTVKLRVGTENRELVRDSDYTVSFMGADPTRPGSYTVLISAKEGSEYSDYKSVSLTVRAPDVKQIYATNTPSIVYDGQYHGTSVGSVTFGRGDNARELKLNEDYVITCTPRKDVGYIRSTITGIGAYKGLKMNKSCEIVKYNIAKDTENNFKIIDQTKPSSYSYKGAKALPIVKFRNETLTEGKDYSIRYKNNKKTGTATYEIIGKGNFSGISETHSFEITNFRMDVAGNVTHKCGAVNYKAGAAVKPAFTIYNATDNSALKANRDYGVVGYTVDGMACSVMPERGKVITVTIRGRGNYEGDYSFDVPVSGVALTSATAASISRVYTTQAISLRPADVKLTYKIKTDAEADIFNADGGRQILVIVNKVKEYSEVSTSIKKGDTILLINGKDYDLSGATYSKNIFVGLGKAEIPGIGYFGGTKTVSFKIGQKIIQWLS